MKEHSHCFAVEVSRDLKAWETLVNERLTNGSFRFTDSNAQVLNERFYRVGPWVPPAR